MTQLKTGRHTGCNHRSHHPLSRDRRRDSSSLSTIKPFPLQLLMRKQTAIIVLQPTFQCVLHLFFFLCVFSFPHFFPFFSLLSYPSTKWIFPPYYWENAFLILRNYINYVPVTPILRRLFTIVIFSSLRTRELLCTYFISNALFLLFLSIAHVERTEM